MLQKPSHTRQVKTIMLNCRCFSTLIVKNLVILIATCVLYSCSGEDWATVAASEVLGLTNDASTGTISARRPAATCDEMLAKAVVLAGEEVYGIGLLYLLYISCVIPYNP
jgi:hypothetical protein